MTWLHPFAVKRLHSGELLHGAGCGQGCWALVIPVKATGVWVGDLTTKKNITEKIFEEDVEDERRHMNG